MTVTLGAADSICTSHSTANKVSGDGLSSPPFEH
jgi:hypothetical protein